MRHPPTADLEALIRELVSAGVELIVVGGAAVRARSIEITDGDLQFRVVDLDALIEIKQSTGRARDALVLPLLLALRDRR